MLDVGALEFAEHPSQFIQLLEVKQPIEYMDVHNESNSAFLDS